MILFLIVVGVLAVCGLVVPFAYGFWRGPRQANRRQGHPDESMRPLGRVADLYVGYFVLVIIFIALGAKDGLYFGGPKGQACVDTGITSEPGRVELYRARPGTSLGASGNLLACIEHPTAGQWALFALTRLPGLLLWCGVLLMIVRLVRNAAKHGPFTPRAARLMVQLGWLIIAGCVVVGDLSGLGATLLTNMVIVPRPFDAGSVVANALLQGPLRVLLPVPALAAVALLSFGRMTKTGAVMDEELRATV